MREQVIETLRPGTRFYMALSMGRKLYGTLIEVWRNSALVEWDAWTRTVLNETQEVPRKRENVSLRTLVVVVE